MTTADLLADLSQQGIELVVHGDRLLYRPRSAVTPDLAERLKTHKPGLLEILRPATASDAASTATVVGEEKITKISKEATVGADKLAPSPQATSELVRWEDCIDPPPACREYGGLVFWWNLLGNRPCMNCDPPIRAIRLLERAEAIRRRQGIPSPIGAAEMLADLKLLTDT